MSEETDTAADAFRQAINPAQTENEYPARAAPLPPRDTGGRFAAVAERPTPLFEMRMVEADPETGDTEDAGDDPALAGREREIADGRVDQRAERQAAENAKNLRRPAVPAEDDGAADDKQAGAGDEADEADNKAAAAEADEDEVDEGQQYEITVDGEPQTVSLGELRDGYIRTATFHSRLNKVNEQKGAVEQENARVAYLRDLYINGLHFLDQDIQGLMPPEPDWDAEYNRDPLAARRRQKDRQLTIDKLNQIRANRAWAIQNGREENDRRSAQYAAEQFTQFVQDHNKLIKDEPSLRRIIGGMRQTALAEGFNEQEVAGVYDKRMLNILFKAWQYDQGMAVRPQAVIPGKGKALVPGSARPQLGSAGRRNIDEAQRQLARTGRMEDAETVFQRLLR